MPPSPIPASTLRLALPPDEGIPPRLEPAVDEVLVPPVPELVLIPPDTLILVEVLRPFISVLPPVAVLLPPGLADPPMTVAEMPPPP